MYKDPIIEEIRKIREAHAAKFNYNIHAIFEDIRKHEAELAKQGWKLVSFAKDNSQTTKKQNTKKKRNKKL